MTPAILRTVTPSMALVERQRYSTGPAYFAYDAAGNRIMVQAGSGTTYWSYDALNRIMNEEEI